jgi:hypothetical protein
MPATSAFGDDVDEYEYVYTYDEAHTAKAIKALGAKNHDELLQIILKHYYKENKKFITG